MLTPQNSFSALKDAERLSRLHSEKYGEYATSDLLCKVYGRRGVAVSPSWDIILVEELCREFMKDLGPGVKRSVNTDMVQISFTGPQGSGKTITADWLRHQFELRSIPCEVTPYSSQGSACDLIEAKLSDQKIMELYVETFPTLAAEPRHHGLGIVIFPTNWRLGFIRRRTEKVVFAIGPIRLCWHKVASK